MYKNKMFLLIVQGENLLNIQQNLPQVPMVKKHLSALHFFTVALVSLLLSIGSPDALAKTKLFEAQLPVVAIDPGHGGKDTGAASPNGILEKAIALKLARLIAQQLEVDYRVVLTRDDDYGLNHSARTSAANHAGADLFISLHTGNSFIRDTNKSTVYFYLPFQGSALRTETEIQPPPAGGETAARWEMIQAKYRSASKKLANHMQTGLASIWPAQGVAVQGIPMVVLEGADMPAVAIEIGNLANAGAEKELADSKFMTQLSGVIADVIKKFLADKP
jgi:N-acetylmuramoyl-L-alanine amidase